MKEQHFELSREELYEKVWSKPVLHVAKEFGISPVGLAKICKRHNIPRPPLGYWAKVQYGHKAKKKPLPPPKKEGEIRISIKPHNRITGQQKEESLPEEFRTRLLEAKKKVATCQPGTESHFPHPLIRWANKAFKKASEKSNGILIPSDRGCLNIQVTEQTLYRALDFFDTLFKLIEDLGYVLTVTENKCAVLDILGEKIELRLIERISRKETSRSSKPKLYDRSMLSYVDTSSSREYISKEYSYVSTGELCLIAKSPDFWMRERRWCDTANSNIEERLSRIMCGLIKYAVLSRSEREEREERERERIKEEQRRQEKYSLWQEKQKLIKEELMRVNDLMDKAENWYKSNVLRSYIDAKRKQAMKINGEIESDSQLGQWFKWADQQADRLDPLIKDPPSIIDEIQ